MNRMKWMLIIFFNLSLFNSLCQADEKQKLTEQKDRESYSLGYQFGEILKKQGLDINLEVYTKGIRDVLDGKELLMNKQEIRETIVELQKRLRVASQKGAGEIAQKNLEAGKAFLEENKKKEGVTALPSGLLYKVLKEGTGKMPKLTDTVTVHYRGTLIDGKEFDSSLKREKPASFKVNGVIRGWTEALQLMKEGSKWQLFIPPNLAYGESGNPTIPPNSALIFEVELISVKEME